MARLDREWTVEGTPALATELHKTLEISHRQAKGIIDAACVKVNGEAARKHGQRLKTGDVVAVSFDPDKAYTVLPTGRTELGDAKVTLLWEDKDLVFVNKPAGLLTVPTNKGTDFCLAEALKAHYGNLGLKRQPLFVVHRLDRHTSGVLVFAKTPVAMDYLKELFEEHRLQRVYRAILVGELPENLGTLNDKLVERSRSLKMAVASSKEDPKGSKRAVTHYRVLERLPGHTVVEVKLETGRRNQIRVQFADRGYPLLGDHVYGQTSPILDRQALHAELLGFKHPTTGESVVVTAPPPADFEAALKTLRNRRRMERAEAGIKGEEGLFKPKTDEERKLSRLRRAKRFGPEQPPKAPEGKGAARPRKEGEAPRSRPARPRSEEGRPSGPKKFGAKPGAPKKDGTKAGGPKKFGAKPAPKKFESSPSGPKKFGGRHAGPKKSGSRD